MWVCVCMWRARSGDYIGIFSSLSKIPRLSVIIVCPRCICVCVCACARSGYVGGCIVLYRFRFPSNDRDRYLLILAGYISVLGSPCEICIFHAAEQIEGILYIYIYIGKIKNGMVLLLVVNGGKLERIMAILRSFQLFLTIVCIYISL